MTWSTRSRSSTLATARVAASSASTVRSSATTVSSGTERLSLHRPQCCTAPAMARSKRDERHDRMGRRSLPGHGESGQHRPMDTRPTTPLCSSSSRRERFLRGAAFTTAGLVAAGIAACAGPAGGTWRVPLGATPLPGTTDPGRDRRPGRDADHGCGRVADADRRGQPGRADAEAVVKRFLGGEWQPVPGYGNQPLEPTMDGDTKVFDMTIDPIVHMLSATLDPVDALGFNGTWPGPLLRVTEGDKIRAAFTNNLPESTGIHFHGQEPCQRDGRRAVHHPAAHQARRAVHLRVHGQAVGLAHVPLAPQRHRPGRSRAARRVPRRSARSGRALRREVRRDPDIVWISNDALGGFTINGRGFPATAPIVGQARREDRHPLHERGAS